MPVTFFTPGNFPPTTGAIVYDTRLAEALRALGASVDLKSVLGRHPEPDEAALQNAAAIAAALPAGRVLIDGFCLYAFAEQATHLTSAIGMLHHPMSQEPQLPEAERARFLAAERALLPCLAHLLVPSEAVRRQLVDAVGLDAAQITVLAPGIPETPRSAGSGGPGRHLLSVASLIPRKGHDTVLRALQSLPDLDWRFTICGDASIDPEHAAVLRRLAEGPGLAGRVTFVGPRTPEQMEALWQSADVFISASIFEGYGMAVAEAVRHGLPLALAREAAAPEVIPAAASAIVEPGDHVQLAKALRRIIYDADVHAALADASWQAGRALPRWEDQAQAFLKHFPG
ncbi:MAG TPA: glycosyltransferase family 4 protein [Acidisoma sp.]|uniref:glycosyltransferase family 4 protein n=1 Tax=Acidisoma sp. TaxID=1872115 RepID=UPI002CBC14E4|nr:glycosyltransferase family 4 protein [Acidisoma sp.]HTI02781.1 glycosyltransferase family 4 protein [Acidisoma sp.]